ncbi:MAG TPA: 8-oxoguanine deaminase [Clostridia bacterium]|nr:8-oxoguanine deaminase [Clostridia bacterium]
MSQKLLKNIDLVVTFNDREESFEHCDILIDGAAIKEIGPGLAAAPDAEIIDCSGLVALPGFVNTHHHLYQTLFRGIKEVQEQPLFPWLIGLYEFWKNITPEAVYYGAMVGFSELLRTGCTLTSDHHYVFPKNQPGTLIDDQIRAAGEIGIRFHATRGSMSLGRDMGGLPPMEVVQTEEAILSDSERLINRYHDPNPLSMQRIALAPCSPFSVTRELMVRTKDLARKKGVMLHTHLAETLDEEKFCLERYGRRPFELMEDLEWVGEDVWYAHGIYLSDDEIDRLKGSGIAHCPSSNMKLNSGICRTTEIVKAGEKLSIAVDGSASNDGSNMWEEVRRAYLLNHLKYGTEGLAAYEILKVATRGGADVLGRDDTGRLDAGKAADIVLFNLNGIEYAGCHDPLVSLVCLGNSSLVDMTIVNGKIVVRDGRLTTIDPDKVAAAAHAVAAELVNKQRNSQ